MALTLIRSGPHPLEVDLTVDAIPQRDGVAARTVETRCACRNRGGEVESWNSLQDTTGNGDQQKQDVVEIKVGLKEGCFWVSRFPIWPPFHDTLNDHTFLWHGSRSERSPPVQCFSSGLLRGILRNSFAIALNFRRVFHSAVLYLPSLASMSHRNRQIVGQVDPCSCLSEDSA